MDHLFVLLLWIFGVLLHIMQKIAALRKEFPQFKPRAVVGTFFAEEWDSLIVSGILLGVYQLGLFICVWKHIAYPQWFVTWGMYVGAIVLGYGGQVIAYKALNTACQVLEQRAERLKTLKGIEEKTDIKN